IFTRPFEASKQGIQPRADGSTDFIHTQDGPITRLETNIEVSLPTGYTVDGSMTMEVDREAVTRLPQGAQLAPEIIPWRVAGIRLIRGKQASKGPQPGPPPR